MSSKNLYFIPMKHLFPILLAFLLPFIAQAQVKDTIPNYLEDDDVIIGPFAYSFPEFPGGHKALFEYLSNNVHYPEQAVKDSIEDRVICQFLVQADGSITDIEVVRSLGYLELDEEAKRVISEMPKWVLKRDPGKYAPVRYTVPVNFKLQ